MTPLTTLDIFELLGLTAALIMFYFSLRSGVYTFRKKEEFKKP